MLFNFKINLVEDDYLSFNLFHSLESSHGRKAAMKGRVIYVSVLLALAVLVLVVLGFTLFSVIYDAILLIMILRYLVFYKKIIGKSFKRHIKRLKKMGKLPFDAESTFEFYEDKVVESTQTKRIEFSYDDIERVCLVSNRYVFLYNSSISAYMIPISQIKEQISFTDFVAFISKKCKNVEYY